VKAGTSLTPYDWPGVVLMKLTSIAHRRLSLSRVTWELSSG
jgi:hypothetical protein